MSFAGYKLPVPASVFEAKPGLDGYLGKKIILGIRPSDFEDSEYADASWARFPIKVGVTEELGTEIHAIFAIDAPPVEHASIASASDGSSEEDETVTALAGGSRCGPPGSPPAPPSAPVSRSSSPSTPAACTSSTRKRRVHRPPADRGHPGGGRR